MEMPPKGRLAAPETREEELEYYKALVRFMELGTEIRRLENEVRQLCRDPKIRKFLGGPKLAQMLRCSRYRANQLLGLDPDPNEDADVVIPSLHP